MCISHLWLRDLSRRAVFCTVQEIKLENQGLVGIVQQDVAFFRALKSLRLDNNLLKDFSPLNCLPNLAQLHLACNRVHSLPTVDSVQFCSLKILDLSFNYVSAEDVFGSDKGWARLPCLRELDLSGNDFRKLPEAIGSFPALQRLSLEFNKLTTDCLKPLSALPRLQHLGVAHNRISGLPKRLLEDPKAFDELTSLDLSCNIIRCGILVQPSLSGLQTCQI
jgi:Leucine-rich repeat (LRR) protein